MWKDVLLVLVCFFALGQVLWGSNFYFFAGNGGTAACWASACGAGGALMNEAKPSGCSLLKPLRGLSPQHHPGVKASAGTVLSPPRPSTTTPPKCPFEHWLLLPSILGLDCKCPQHDSCSCCHPATKTPASRCSELPAAATNVLAALSFFLSCSSWRFPLANTQFFIAGPMTWHEAPWLDLLCAVMASALSCEQLSEEK